MTAGGRALEAAGRAVLAAWDRIEEAKAGAEGLEARLAAIRPHQAAMVAAIDDLRDVLTAGAD